MKVIELRESALYGNDVWRALETKMNAFQQHNQLMVMDETTVQTMQRTHEKEVKQLGVNGSLVFDKTLEVSQETKQTIISTDVTKCDEGFLKTPKFQREIKIVENETTLAQLHDGNEIIHTYSSSIPINDGKLIGSDAVSGELIQKVGFHGVRKGSLQVEYSGKRIENGVTTATKHLVKLSSTFPSTLIDESWVTLIDGIIKQVEGVTYMHSYSREFKPGQEKIVLARRIKTYQYNASSDDLSKDNNRDQQDLNASDEDILNRVKQKIDEFRRNHQEIVTKESTLIVANVAEDRYLGLVKENYSERNGVIDESSRVF